MSKKKMLKVLSAMRKAALDKMVESGRIEGFSSVTSVDVIDVAERLRSFILLAFKESENEG